MNKCDETKKKYAIARWVADPEILEKNYSDFFGRLKTISNLVRAVINVL